MSVSLSPALCREASHTLPFARSTRITREDGTQGYCSPTGMQSEVATTLDDHRFVLVLKHRQAYVSTIAWMWMLSQVEYSPGTQGVFIANRKEVAEDIWARARYAYDQQDPRVRVPASRDGAHGLAFDHGGSIKVMTAGSKTPAIGSSVDRLVCTEFGFWQSARNAVVHLFPGFIKRPNARALIESTPGNHGSAHHQLVMDTLGNPGTSRWKLVFLKWWLDPTCRMPAQGFAPDLSELRLMEKLPGLTFENLMFRRMVLQDFGGDVRRFDSKYPSDPYDCWFTEGTPAFPPEALDHLRLGMRHDPPLGQGWDPYDPECEYFIVADPNNYGKSGDPSAFSLWNASTRREVAAWSGRMDPVAFSRTLADLGAKYGKCCICIESNAPSSVAALHAIGYPNIYYNDDSPDRPGMWMSKPAKERMHGLLVRLLREKDMLIRSHEGVHQLMGYDGGTTRVDNHHWDRVITYLMAAQLLYSSYAPRSKAATLSPPGTMSAARLSKMTGDKLALHKR